MIPETLILISNSGSETKACSDCETFLNFQFLSIQHMSISKLSNAIDPSKKYLPWFFIVGGAFLLILGILVFTFERKSINQVYFEIILGIIFLVYGTVLFIKQKQLAAK